MDLFTIISNYTPGRSLRLDSLTPSLGTVPLGITLSHRRLSRLEAAKYVATSGPERSCLVRRCYYNRIDIIRRAREKEH